MAERGFQVVEEVPDEPTPIRKEQPAAPKAAPNQAAIGLIMLSLKALSQRALVALESLFTLITVGLVFWLWASIPHPDTLQIVSLAIFAVFVLAANVIVRHK